MVLCLLYVQPDTEQELLEKYICIDVAIMKSADSAMHPSYRLKLKYSTAHEQHRVWSHVVCETCMCGLVQTSCDSTQHECEVSITMLKNVLTRTSKDLPLHIGFLKEKIYECIIDSNQGAVTTSLLEVYQTLFQAGTYNL